VGDTVDVRAHDGSWLARAAHSPASQIRARVWTFDEAEPVDESFFATRLDAAVAARARLVGSGLDAYRLVYAESDGLPGVIVDRYADHLVCQLSSAGAERWRGTLVEQLGRRLEPAGIYERSDSGARRLEGLEQRAGAVAGAEPPDVIEIREGECRYLVDVRAGHKTGFYLDQRESRALVHARAGGADVLNCFSYTGGFGIAAAVGGALSVTNLETSAPANVLAKRNAELNGIGTDRFTIDARDVFEALRAYRDARRSFDLVVLDPPKFAESRAHVERAARGYKDLNLLAFKLLRPGGLLVTFSCSGHMKPDLFQKVVADAALDAGRNALILDWLRQPADHPTALAFPEASYLKGLVVRVG
jgi:23S rRNA (cytosine1962-C5)-methyltransferase